MSVPYHVSTFVATNFTGIVMHVEQKAMLARLREEGIMAVQIQLVCGAQVCKSTDFLNADPNYEAACLPHQYKHITCTSCDLHEALTYASLKM